MSGKIKSFIKNHSILICLLIAAIIIIAMGIGGVIIAPCKPLAAWANAATIIGIFIAITALFIAYTTLKKTENSTKATFLFNIYKEYSSNEMLFYHRTLEDVFNTYKTEEKMALRQMCRVSVS